MNNLKSYIEDYINRLVYEEGEAVGGAVVGTPANTLGMGNPMTPTDVQPGSEPIVTAKSRKERKNKSKTKKLKESLFDDEGVLSGPGKDKIIIENWIQENYEVKGHLKINDDLAVDCSGDVEVENYDIEYLTNGMFRWGKVGGCFECSECRNLKSLEGAPETVGGNFNCSWSKNLTSLEGAPKEVSGDFICINHRKLKITDSDRKKI